MSTPRKPKLTPERDLRQYFPPDLSPAYVRRQLQRIRTESGIVTQGTHWIYERARIMYLPIGVSVVKAYIRKRYRKGTRLKGTFRPPKTQA